MMDGHALPLEMRTMNWMEATDWKKREKHFKDWKDLYIVMNVKWNGRYVRNFRYKYMIWLTLETFIFIYNIGYL